MNPESRPAPGANHPLAYGLVGGLVYLASVISVSLATVPLREMVVTPLLGDLPSILLQLGLMCAVMSQSSRLADSRGVVVPGWAREAAAVVIAIAVLFSADVVAASLW